MTLIDVREELLAKTKALDEVFDAARTDDGYDFMQVKGHGFDERKDQKSRVELAQQMMAEVNDLGAKADEFAKAQAADEQIKNRLAGLQGIGELHPGAGAVGGDQGGGNVKSIGELFVASAGYLKDRGRGSEIDIDLAMHVGAGSLERGVKTLMTTSAGWAPESIRTGKLVEYAMRPIQVIDLIPGEQTDQASIPYMEETTATNAAAETAEGGTFPESALALTEKTSPVRKISTWIPVTDEQLEDVAYVQSYINNRLGFFVRQRLDGQILVGDGVAPNLEGLNNRTGVLTQSAAGMAALDALRIAKRKVAVTGRANANAVFINPLNMEYLALLRTPDGIYILANPNDDTGLDRLWGMRTVETDAQTANTALVKDTTQTGLAIRRNVTLAVSNSHSTYFVEGKQAIRADMRVALQDYRPAAGCKVTNLPQVS